MAESYEGRRWQEARAQVQRVLREAGIDDPGFFTDRVLLEIGPGPVGLPEASGAKLAFAIEPLAPRLDAAGLLLRGDAIYLATGAEAIPLLDGSVDVVVARNCLDHVTDPEAVTAEVARVLMPGGMLILNVDVDGEPTAEEPHAFSADDVRRIVQAAARRARALDSQAPRPRRPAARGGGHQGRGLGHALDYAPRVNFALVAFGLGVGILVGMTGIGVGSPMTPMLILVFGVTPTTAIGTDLAYAAVTKTVGG